MSNLNAQLLELTNKAIMSIAAKLDKSNNVITLINDEDKNLSAEDGDDFYRLVADKTIMLTHYFEEDGNEDVYVTSITGNETDCFIMAKTAYEDSKQINLFELDAHNLTLLADYLLND